MTNTDMEEGMHRPELVVDSKGRAGKSGVARCCMLTVANLPQCFEKEISGRSSYLSKYDTEHWDPLT
jgi:hypothetical protein